MLPHGLIGSTGLLETLGIAVAVLKSTQGQETGVVTLFDRWPWGGLWKDQVSGGKVPRSLSRSRCAAAA